jgi:putative phage-type endonuclease
MLTEAQKKERLLGIGGSEAHYITGLSPYKSPVEVYLAKTGEVEEEDISSEAMYWGNNLEKTVADEYANRTGVEVEKPEHALVHPEYYWLRCNLDFYVKGMPVVGECKTVGYFNNEIWGDEGTETIPDQYLFQCMHNAIVSEAFYNTERVDLPVLGGGKGGLRFRIYQYERNRKLEERYIDISRKFWQEHVEKGIPPEPTSREDAALLWPDNSDENIVANSNVMEALSGIKAIKAAIKKLKEEEEKKEAEIATFMKDAAAILDTDGQVLATWKSQETRRLDMETFKKSLPDVYGQFLKQSTSRVMRIK